MGDARDDDAPGRRDAADRERAVDQRLRLAAVQRHPQQLHRAPPLHARRARRRRPATVAGVSSPRWCCSGSSSGSSGPPAAATRQGTACRATKSSPSGPRSGTAVTTSVRAVGAVRRQRAVAPRVRHPAQDRSRRCRTTYTSRTRSRSARSCRAETKASSPPSGAPGRRPRSRRRPTVTCTGSGSGRGVVLEVRGQVERRTPGCGRSPRKPTSSSRYFSVVISRGGSAPGPDPLDRAVPALLGHPRGVGEPAGVRRPDRRPGAEAVVGQPAGDPAGRGQQVDLRLAAGLGAEVGQPAAVGREGRRGVARTGGDRPRRRGAVGGHRPQLAAVLVGGEVEAGDGDDGHPAVRGHGRDPRGPEELEVGRPHDGRR